MAGRIILQCLKNVPVHTRLIPSISSTSVGRSIFQTHQQSRPNFGIVRNFSSAGTEAEGDSEESAAQPAVRDPAKDRSEPVPVEVSMRYIKSKGMVLSI